MTDLRPLSPDVAAGLDGGTGVVELTRPQAINSLTTDMCRVMHDQLNRWADDDAVTEVEIRGAGPKGLCAGGDVRQVRERILADDPDGAMEFFETEFAMDAAIAHYPKPTRALQRGIVMGGGLGISAHCSQRLAYADSKIAMPETIIGYFPDVGMLWLLARAPGELGVHLALTGATINAADSILVGFSDRMADGEQAPEATLTDAEWMRECYAGDDAAQIIGRLEASQEPEARKAAEAIRLRSPLSVWISLWGLRRAAAMAALDDVFAQDLALARHTMTNPDFAEGVRAQLIDKDRNPSWRHARIEDVPRADVERMFVG